MIRVIAILVALALAACGAASPPTLMVARVDEPLLNCQDAPDVPDPDTATQREAAVFITRLFGAWQDCFGNLTAVKDLIHKQQVETQTK